MGKVTYADGIAIFQIVYFVPALLLCLFLLVRWKSFAWFFLSTFSILRIVGGVARLLTISHPNSNAIWTTALICTILGLSPLLMATLTLLGRALRAFFKKSMITSIVFLVHAPAALALILCIIGANDANSAATITDEDKVKIGVCLYIPVLAALALLTAVCFLKQRASGKGERGLIRALMAVLPLLLIRLLFALLTVFSHGGTFGIQNGSQTAALLMAVLEEMIVVLIFVAAGLKLSAETPESTDSQAEIRRSGMPPMQAY